METFPRFTMLDASDHSGFAAAVDRFDPYSEFSFACIFAWSGRHSVGASVLRDNLVVEFRDYDTYQPVWSVIGDTDIDETLAELLGHVTELKFVPTPVVAAIEHADQFSVVPDRANFDYVYGIASYLDLGCQWPS